jgi:hypothetical protein
VCEQTALREEAENAVIRAEKVKANENQSSNEGKIERTNM